MHMMMQSWIGNWKGADALALEGALVDAATDAEEALLAPLNAPAVLRDLLTYSLSTNSLVLILLCLINHLFCFQLTIKQMKQK